MSRSLDDARLTLEAQPFSRLLKAELTAYSRQGAELRIPLSDQLKQQHGFAHGGVVSYAADNALTFAAGAVLGPMIVTSEYKINYVRPAIGQTLIARANVVYSGKSQAVCRCEVFIVSGDSEKLCAIAQGTISRIGATSSNFQEN